jgi:hypothetical protein
LSCYAVDEAHFTNDKATAGGGWFFGNEDEAGQTADSLRAASYVTVFYDASEPSHSVLERGLPARDFGGVMVAVPLTGVAAGMAFNHFSRRRIPDARQRRSVSIRVGIAVAVVGALLQWLALEILL